MPVHRFRYFFKPWETLTHEEMAVDRLGRSPLYRLLSVLYLLAGSLAVWRLCRRHRYDIIHVHWPLPHALFGWLAKKACRAKLVTTFYGAEIRWAKHSPLAFMKKFIAWAAQISDRVIAISTYTRDELKSLVAVPIEVVPYTIGFSGRQQKRISERDEKRMILTVGRLVERKGIRYLIEAMGHLPGDLGAELVVVGAGPLRESLEEYCKNIGGKDRVRFVGRVSEKELTDLYQRADVYVQPAIFDSRGDTEMLGVVLLEAMYYRVPVVASAVGGITDVVEDEVTGLLVPPQDPWSIAQAIERILRDARLKGKLTTNAHRLLLHNFSWDNILEKIIKVYGNL